MAKCDWGMDCNCKFCEPSEKDLAVAAENEKQELQEQYARNIFPLTHLDYLLRLKNDNDNEIFWLKRKVKELENDVTRGWDRLKELDMKLKDSEKKNEKLQRKHERDRETFTRRIRKVINNYYPEEEEEE